MSKAKYHVPQPGESITFDGFIVPVTVKSWDSKHGTLTIQNGGRLHIKNRSSIKPAEPFPSTAPKIALLPTPFSDALKSRPCTEEHLFREPVAVSTEFTARLPTSFASEVERAKAIADAEAENKTRHEAAEAKCDELSDKIAALINERRDVMADDEDAQHDFENRLEYLRSLRIRQNK